MKHNRPSYGGAEQIIFDYRRSGQETGGVWQLVVQPEVEVCNEILFNEFYALLGRTIAAAANDTLIFWELNKVLNYHYENTPGPKFLYVTVLASIYREALQEGTLTPYWNAVTEALDRWLEEHERNSVIYEGTVRIAAIAGEAEAERMQVPLGTPYTYIPVAETPLQAFQHLKFLTGQQVCEYYVGEFKKNYSEPTSEIYVSEIERLNRFIATASISELDEAFSRPSSDRAHEYLRLTNGYYLNHRCEATMGGISAQVYGMYILYKKWLEDRLRESFISKKPQGLPMLEPGPINDSSLLGRETFELLFKRSRLSDFFLVPAPPKKGRFWYDINDQDTTDPAQVVRVSEVSISQRRRATTADFLTIHDRVNLIADTSGAAYRYFIADLVVVVRTMITYHQTLYQPQEREADHYALLELADHFIQWMDDRGERPGAAPVLTEKPAQAEGKPFPQRAIAMYCIYTGRQVTRQNCAAIGAEFGHGAGGKIYNTYQLFSRRQNIVAAEDTELKNRKKLELLLSVKNRLQDLPHALARAEKDLADFKRAAELE